MKNAAKFNTQNNDLNKIEKNIEHFNNAMDPFARDRKNVGSVPFYSTGARALIRVAGKSAGVSQSIRWRVGYVATPVHTIDTPHAWDIDVGAASISATIDSIMDPTAGLEASGMFHTMSSAVHAPMVELQVLDKSGTSLFFARGIFLEISGNVQFGQLSSWNARFTGVAYQHYVGQQFKPYDGIASATGKMLGSLQGLASDLTGGIL